MSLISSLKKSVSPLVLATVFLAMPACSQAEQVDPAQAPVEQAAAPEVAEAPAPNAPVDQAEVVASVEEGVTEQAAEDVESSRRAVLEDAVEALEHTEKALAALQSEDRETAIDELALAAGKLDIVLARDPELAFAPFDVTTSVQDVLVDVDTVRVILPVDRLLR